MTKQEHDVIYAAYQDYIQDRNIQSSVAYYELFEAGFKAAIKLMMDATLKELVKHES